MAAGKASYREALRNRDFRLLVGALTQSAMGDWAYNVALVVYVYDRTHSATWVSAATIGRMIPRFFASPYAGVIAERFERVHVMVTADLVRMVLMTGLTIVVAVHSPAWVAIAVASLISLSACVYDPATSAMVPQLLGEEQLAAGNALTETINNVAIIGGPAVGAIVLALGSPPIVMGIDAVTFAISAILVSRMQARSTPTDVSADGGPFRQMAVGIKTLFGSATALLLTSFPIFTTMLYGVDTVLFIYVSKEKLHTGATGYGYLLVALGVGGVIAAFIVNRLAALSRLSLVLSLGMIAYCLPTAALVGLHSPTAAFVIEVVRGIATLVVDVLAMTALQRSLAPELISRVFGVFWAVLIGGLALGAAVAAPLLDNFGLNTTLWLDALVIPALVLVAFPRLALLDRGAAEQAEVLAPRVRILEAFDIFAAAPRPVLERLARSVTEVDAAEEELIIREGDRADALYVLVDGRVDVFAKGERGRRVRHIRFMRAPAYFGEIGLLQGIPRTASIAPTEPSKLWRIDGETFLSALTETTLSPSFASGLSMRLARTNPSAEVKLPEPRTAADETVTT